MPAMYLYPLHRAATLSYPWSQADRCPFMGKLVNRYRYDGLPWHFSSISKMKDSVKSVMCVCMCACVCCVHVCVVCVLCMCACCVCVVSV